MEDFNENEKSDEIAATDLRQVALVKANSLELDLSPSESLPSLSSGNQTVHSQAGLVRFIEDIEDLNKGSLAHSRQFFCSGRQFGILKLPRSCLYYFR